MLLKYRNLTIRDAVVQDAEQLAQWWNDGRVMAHAGFPNGTGETAQEIAESIKTCDTSHSLLMIEIDDIAIGEMSVRWEDDATAAIGIKPVSYTHLDVYKRQAFMDEAQCGYQRFLLYAYPKLKELIEKEARKQKRREVSG